MSVEMVGRRGHCAGCGEKLGFRHRLDADAYCDDCRESAGKARAVYVSLLHELASSARTPSALQPELEAAGAASRFTPTERDDLARQAVTEMANAILADDVISVEEERRIVEVVTAAGFAGRVEDALDGETWARFSIGQINAGRLPDVTAESSFVTKSGESVHLEVPATLLKEVTLREFQAGSRGVSFRIAKGVYYRAGSTRGKSVVTGTEMRDADSGTLFVTSTRAVFVGTRSTIELDYRKLVELVVYSDGVQFHVSNRKIPPLFRLPSGERVAAVINAASHDERSA